MSSHVISLPYTARKIKADQRPLSYINTAFFVPFCLVFLTILKILLYFFCFYRHLDLLQKTNTVKKQKYFLKGSQMQPKCKQNSSNLINALTILLIIVCQRESSFWAAQNVAFHFGAQLLLRSFWKYDPSRSREFYGDLEHHCARIAKAKKHTKPRRTKELSQQEVNNAR